MPNSSKSVQINFRVPEEYKVEWEKWQALAKEEGKELRDWIFPKVRQALAPRPKPVADSTSDALKRGRRIGLMIGRLDMVFQMDREEDIDPGWITDWIARYPDCVDDVRLFLLGKPYGLRFEKWWRWLTNAGSSAAQ